MGTIAPVTDRSSIARLNLAFCTSEAYSSAILGLMESFIFLRIRPYPLITKLVLRDQKFRDKQKLTGKALAKFEAKRDVWQEILDGVREIEAGGGKRTKVEAKLYVLPALFLVKYCADLIAVIPIIVCT